MEIEHQIASVNHHPQKKHNLFLLHVEHTNQLNHQQYLQYFFEHVV